MNFNPDLTRITQNALTHLKGKTFGGVSKESAQEAVEHGVTEVIRQGREAIGQVQQEMTLLRNKTAQEISQITSEKDVAIFNAKQEAQQKIATAQKAADEKVKQAKAPKTFEKLLENGNKLIRKVNQNGAVMEKELITTVDKNQQPVERVLRAKVETLAGDIRKTTYNPQTGKPVKTYTNTNGSKIYEYKEDGFATKVDDVNVKNVKAEKPTIITQTPAKPVPGYWQGETGMEFERIYSDGSKDTITKILDRNHNDNTRVKLVKVDKDGNFLEETTKWENGAVRTNKRMPNGANRESETFINQEGQPVTYYSERLYDTTTSERVTTEFGGTYQNLRYSAKIQKDEFGLYTGKYKAKIKFPKESGKKPMIITGTQTEISNTINEMLK